MGAIQSNVRKLFLTMKTHQVKTLLFFSLLFLSFFSCKIKENTPVHTFQTRDGLRIVKLRGKIEIKMQSAEILPDSVFTNYDDSTMTFSPEIPFFKYDIPTFIKELTEDISYPTISEGNDVQGTVIASFIVGKDKIMRDINIEQGIDKNCDKEVRRALWCRNYFYYWIHTAREKEAVRFFVEFKFKIIDPD